MIITTGYERTKRILERKSVDRIGFYEHFWTDTITKYKSQGKMQADSSEADHFGFDLSECWPFNYTANLDFTNEIVAEDEDTITEKDGNGAILRRHKKHDSTPEHIDFYVKTSKEWQEYKPFLTNIDIRRINFEEYRKAREAAKKAKRFFLCSQPNVFELMHPITGHENMLIGMALEPEWIMDMCQTYTDLTIALQEILFEKEGEPDGIWYYEDMGYKQKPFISPAMYKELLMPYHKKTIDFAHGRGLKVIMHSCGFVEPLLPHMIEAGIDCYQAIEVKAGMDLLKIHKDYGDRLSLMGGLDVRAICSNKKSEIDAELEKKIPQVKQGFG